MATERPSAMLAIAQDRNKRGEDGSESFYSAIARQVAALGPRALANVDVERDVVAVENHGLTTFMHKATGHDTYLVTGQVAGTEEGAALGANGPIKHPINDDSVIRPKLPIVEGTLAPGAVADQANNDRAYVEDLPSVPIPADDLIQGPDQPRIFVSQPLRKSEAARKASMSSGGREPARDVLILTLPPLYRNINKTKSTSNPRSSRGSRNVRASVVVEQSDDAKMEHGDDPEDKPPVQVGTLYDPALLPGHDQPGINHSSGIRVEQPDVRDIDGNLIPPWDFPSQLRPGTYIKAIVQPVCWVYRSTDKVNKVYALLVKSLQVLDESDEEVQPQPTIYDGDSSSTPVKRPDVISLSFDSLTSPCPKRRRVL
ncbi:hypothetical protein GGG16DRAFT_103992 [Schizophyllum commune]